MVPRRWPSHFDSDRITNQSLLKHSWQLAGAVLLVDLMASFFCLFGWFTESIDVVTVVRIWIYSLVVFALGDLVHRTLAGSESFNRLCHFRFSDSLSDRERMRRLENEVAELQRVAIEHERAGLLSYTESQKAST